MLARSAVKRHFILCPFAVIISVECVGDRNPSSHESQHVIADGMLDTFCGRTPVCIYNMTWLFMSAWFSHIKECDSILCGHLRLEFLSSCRMRGSLDGPVRLQRRDRS